jgi:hypothetical protein
MKTQIIILIIFLFLGAIDAKCQVSRDTADYPYYIEMMQNDSVNFYAVQKAFYKYYNKHKDDYKNEEKEKDDKNIFERIFGNESKDHREKEQVKGQKSNRERERDEQQAKNKKKGKEVEGEEDEENEGFAFYFRWEYITRRRIKPDGSRISATQVSEEMAKYNAHLLKNNNQKPDSNKPEIIK